jgi:hypothetical protein
MSVLGDERSARGTRRTKEIGDSDLHSAYEAARSDGYEPDSASMRSLAKAEDRYQDRRREWRAAEAAMAANDQT